MSERRTGNFGILGCTRTIIIRPRNLRSRVRHVASRIVQYIVHYSELDHFIADFAGNLNQLKIAYATAYATGDSETKAKLLRQFDSIVDQLTLANGVTKQTYANRHERVLSAVLSAIKIHASEIRVLDLPSSTGASCLRSLEQLQEKGYRVTSYVLADTYHTILYDPQRRCIFDEDGNLLQVAFKRFFFGLYRVGVLENRHTFLIGVLAFPRSIIAKYLRKRYPFRHTDECQRLLVVHPQIEQLFGRGVFVLGEMDVFKPIPGRYDLILSFRAGPGNLDRGIGGVSA
jgi:hypothetical protein